MVHIFVCFSYIPLVIYYRTGHNNWVALYNLFLQSNQSLPDISWWMSWSVTQQITCYVNIFGYITHWSIGIYLLRVDIVKGNSLREKYFWKVKTMSSPSKIVNIDNAFNQKTKGQICNSVGNLIGVPMSDFAHPDMNLPRTMVYE